MAELRERAIALADRGREIQNAPFMQRPALAAEFAEDVSAFLVDVAERLDALTPYADEIEGAG
jgi:ABC-type phosphate/phosphonate transport system substrate-binding protein